MTENGKEFRETGNTEKKSPNHYFSTRDLLYLCTIGMIGGIISSIVPFKYLVTFWFPFTGGGQLVAGHHVLWMTMAYGFTRKSGAPIVTSAVKGLFEFMIGDTIGIFVLVLNLVEGAGTDAFFFIARKLKEDKTKLGWALAGAAGTFIQVPILWWITGRFALLPWVLTVIALMFSFISGVLIAGLLGRATILMLGKAGIQTMDFLSTPAPKATFGGSKTDPVGVGLEREMEDMPGIELDGRLSHSMADQRPKRKRDLSNP